jgi:hypothetical protein
MIGHKLPNKNEKCYSSRTQTFSPTKQPHTWTGWTVNVKIKWPKQCAAFDVQGCALFAALGLFGSHPSDFGRLIKAKIACLSGCLRGRGPNMPGCQTGIELSILSQNTSARYFRPVSRSFMSLFLRFSDVINSVNTFYSHKTHLILWNPFDHFIYLYYITSTYLINGYAAITKLSPSELFGWWLLWLINPVLLS